MTRPRHFYMHPPGPKLGACEARPSTAPEPDGNDDDRRNRQALIDYFRLLQEWSVKAQRDGVVGDPNCIPGRAPKAKKDR